MEKNKILTAEEFYTHELQNYNPSRYTDEQITISMMDRYAKHVAEGIVPETFKLPYDDFQVGFNKCVWRINEKIEKLWII